MEKELSQSALIMKLSHTFFVMACLFCLAPFARGEFDKKNILGLSGSELVYDFLTELKKEYSMVSSRELFAFITEDKMLFDKETLDQRKNARAWVETVIVVEILGIAESVEGDIVTAVVRTTEHQVEFLCFRVANSDENAKLVPSKLRDKSSPHFTPWLTRQFYK